MFGIAWWENYPQNFQKKGNALPEIGHFGGCVLLAHNQNQGWLPPLAVAGAIGNCDHVAGGNSS